MEQPSARHQQDPVASFTHQVTILLAPHYSSSSNLPSPLPPFPRGGSDYSPTRTHAVSIKPSRAHTPFVISIVPLSKFNAAAGTVTSLQAADFSSREPSILFRDFFSCRSRGRGGALPPLPPGGPRLTGSRRRLGPHDVRARRGRHLARRRRRGRRRRGGCPSVSGTPLRLMRLLSCSSC